MKTVFKDVALIVGTKRRILTARTPKTKDHPRDWELPNVISSEEENKQILKDYLKKTFRVRAYIQDLFKEVRCEVRNETSEYELVFRIYHTKLVDSVVKSDDHVDLSWVRAHNYDNVHWNFETSVYIDFIQLYIVSY